MATRSTKRDRSEKPESTRHEQKPPRGRPRTIVNWATFDKLCAIHCTLQEISDVMEIPMNTLEGAIKRDFHTTFANHFRTKSARGKMSLRRAQYESAVGRPAVFDSKGRIVQPAVKPTPDMQKWLGVQWLGQTPDGSPDPNSELENYDDDMPADAVAR